MLRADEVSGQSHCNLWWRWWWSDAMWETLIRLWLYELSYCLQVFVADISLQFWRYMESCASVEGVCVFRQLGIQHYRMCIYCLNERYTWLHCKLQWSSLLLECFAEFFCNMQREETRESHTADWMGMHELCWVIYSMTGCGWSPYQCKSFFSSLRPVSQYCKNEANIYDLTILSMLFCSTLVGSRSWATWIWGSCVQLPCDLQWVLQSTHDFPPSLVPWCVLFLPPRTALQLNVNEIDENWLWCSLLLIPAEKYSVFWQIPASQSPSLHTTGRLSHVYRMPLQWQHVCHDLPLESQQISHESRWTFLTQEVWLLGFENEPWSHHLFWKRAKNNPFIKLFLSSHDCS